MTDVDGAVFGDIEYEIVKADDPRLPHPPEAFVGNVCAMIGTGTVIHVKLVVAEAEFTKELTDEHLDRLRGVTRSAFKDKSLTDDECDAIINEFGPETAEDEFLP